MLRRPGSGDLARDKVRIVGCLSCRFPYSSAFDAATWSQAVRLIP